jgi:superfamily II DNA/RNA helicase
MVAVVKGISKTLAFYLPIISHPIKATHVTNGLAHGAGQDASHSWVLPAAET